MTIIQHPTASQPPPRTVLTLAASLDAVMVRVDAAGLRADQICAVSLSPNIWDGGLSMPIKATVQLYSVDGFEDLVGVFGNHSRNDTGDWLNADCLLPDGTAVNVTAPNLARAIA